MPLGWLLALVLGGPGPALAQVVAHPFVAAGLRPQVLTTATGVPLVNITTPTPGGVSFNLYQRFDVAAPGVVLNNGRSASISQLGGPVAANPWLARGPARIIVNQVASGNPSLLHGPIEVAGSGAEVVVANPNGIQVDGGRFIQASRVALTTGQPRVGLGGTLDGFVVQGGRIDVDGAGLDLRNVDYAAILARALRVNAKVQAQVLEIRTGANDLSADGSRSLPVAPTGAAPRYALDVAALGGLYARSILLVGSERGLGARNAGTIGAGPGELVITAAGRLENVGTIEAARLQVSIDGDLDNRGGVVRQTGPGLLDIASGALLNARGRIGDAPPGAATNDPTLAGSPAGAMPANDRDARATAAASVPAASAAIPGAAPAAAEKPAAPGLLHACGSLLNDGGRIEASGPVSIAATELANPQGIVATGARIAAGRDASLLADHRIELGAAAQQSRVDDHSSGRSQSAGATFGAGAQTGLSFQLGASRAEGQRRESGLRFDGTRVSAGRTAIVRTGEDLRLDGATLAAPQLDIDIAGDLLVTSLQDQRLGSSHQSSKGGSISLCIPPICYGSFVTGSAAVAGGSGSAVTASPNTQAGLRAGDGGFVVKVAGTTRLTGGVIASSSAAEAAGVNQLTTGAIVATDLANVATGSASSHQLSVSSDAFSQGKYGLAKAALGNALDHGAADAGAAASTRSAVGLGQVIVTNEAKQQALTGQSGAAAVAGLNRDTAGSDGRVVAVDEAVLQKRAREQQAGRNLPMALVTPYTDDAYRLLFQTKPTFSRTTCNVDLAACLADPRLVPTAAQMLPTTPPPIDLQRQQEQLRDLREANERRIDERLGPAAAALGSGAARIPPDESPCVRIDRIELAGEGAEQFQWAIAADVLAGIAGDDPPLGRCLGTAGADLVLSRVQSALVAQGWVTTRVLAAPQDLTAGTLRLTLVPGRIAAVRLTGDSSPPRFGADALIASALPAQPGDLLNLRDLEQALENLKRAPTVQAEVQIDAPLDPTAAPGTSDLVIRFVQAQGWRLSTDLDDSGARATGRHQGSLTAARDNPLGLNDLFYVNLGRGIGSHGFDGERGTESQVLHYSVPFGHWLLAMTASAQRSFHVVQGANQDYLHHERSRHGEVELSRTLWRDQRRKTTLGLQGWRRSARSFTDDGEIGVQRRLTAGWLANLRHKEFFDNGATLEGTLGLRRGTGAFGAMRSAEEAFGEGTSRLKVLNAELALLAPLPLAGGAWRYSGTWRAQWNRTPLGLPDRFAIGSRYTVRGFDGESSLLGDRGWFMRHEVARAFEPAGVEGYVGLDGGVVGGPSTAGLAGRRLAGAVMGLRGHRGVHALDVFIGRPLHRPPGFRTAAWAGGFSLHAQF